MRYDPRQRRTFPNIEDWYLWLALERIGLPYEKIPTTKPAAPLTENWYVTAKIYYDDTHYGYIDWGGKSYLTSHSLNNNTVKIMALRHAYIKEQGIPLLLLKRRSTAYEMEIEIRRWLDRVKKKY